MQATMQTYTRALVYVAKHISKLQKISVNKVKMF